MKMAFTIGNQEEFDIVIGKVIDLLPDLVGNYSGQMSLINGDIRHLSLIHAG